MRGGLHIFQRTIQDCGDHGARVSELKAAANAICAASPTRVQQPHIG